MISGEIIWQCCECGEVKTTNFDCNCDDIEPVDFEKNIRVISPVPDGYKLDKAGNCYCEECFREL